MIDSNPPFVKKLMQFNINEFKLLKYLQSNEKKIDVDRQSDDWNKLKGRFYDRNALKG